jgi:hypothetical protein
VRPRILRWQHVAFIENAMAGALYTAPTSNTTRRKSSTCRKTNTVRGYQPPFEQSLWKEEVSDLSVFRAGLTEGTRHDQAAGASTTVFELSTLSYTDTSTIG